MEPRDNYVTSRRKSLHLVYIFTLTRQYKSAQCQRENNPSIPPNPCREVHTVFTVVTNRGFPLHSRQSRSPELRPDRWVESANNRLERRFRFLESASKQESSLAIRFSLMANVRILVADDHEIVSRGLCNLLQSRGWEVCGEAGDGRQAVDMVQQLHPDVVILDIGMPNLNGLDATRQIRSEEHTSELQSLTNLVCRLLLEKKKKKKKHKKNKHNKKHRKTKTQNM